MKDVLDEFGVLAMIGLLALAVAVVVSMAVQDVRSGEGCVDRIVITRCEGSTSPQPELVCADGKYETFRIQNCGGRLIPVTDYYRQPTQMQIQKRR